MTHVGRSAEEPPGPRADRRAADAGAGWPPSVYAGGDEAWREYLRDLYYLGGLLYVAGKGEDVLAALVGVANCETQAASGGQ